MKKILIVLVALLVLAACGGSNVESKLEKVGTLSKEESTIVVTKEDGSHLTYDNAADKKVVYFSGEYNTANKIVNYYTNEGIIEFAIPAKEGKEENVYCIYDVATGKTSELSENICNSTDQSASAEIAEQYSKLLEELSVTQEQLVEYYESQFEA